MPCKSKVLSYMWPKAYESSRLSNWCPLVDCQSKSKWKFHFQIVGYYKEHLRSNESQFCIVQCTIPTYEHISCQLRLIKIVEKWLTPLTAMNNYSQYVQFVSTASQDSRKVQSVSMTVCIVNKYNLLWSEIQLFQTVPLAKCFKNASVTILCKRPEITGRIYSDSHRVNCDVLDCVVPSRLNNTFSRYKQLVQVVSVDSMQSWWVYLVGGISKYIK